MGWESCDGSGSGDDSGGWFECVVWDLNGMNATDWVMPATTN